MIEARDIIVRELRREARLKIAASLVMTLVASSLLVVAARHRSQASQDWATALGLAGAGLACAAASASRRTAVAVLFGAPILVLVAALAVGGEGAMGAALGGECLATELAVGALVVAAAWLAIRSGSSVLGLRVAAASAATGALGGAAALQLTCPARDALAHLLAFHVGGVALASGVAAVVTVVLSRADGAPDQAP